MRWRMPAILLLAVALAGVGYVYLPYVGWSNSEADARQRVSEYLAAVVRETGDRGWNVLEGSGRAQYGSEDAYRATMAGADWTDFAWEFGDSPLCDDGVCTFVLRLPNGTGSAPDVAWSVGPGDFGVLLPTKDSTGSAREAGEAYINVLQVLQRGWFGGIGVVVFGVGNSH
jgi:hypothetical protein